MADPWFLVADIGGTNVRFAAFQGDRQVTSVSHETKQSDDLPALVQAFAETLPQRPAVTVAAAAGPVRNNAVRLTNAGHSLCGDTLRTATGAQQAFIINDFAAAAWATLDAGPADLKVIAGAPHLGPGTRVVLGPGTGLGVGALVFDGGTYHSVTGEGGHIGTGPRNSFEATVFEALRSFWPEIFFGKTLIIEAEGILSGTGLPSLYRAIQMVDGLAPIALPPAEIFDRARVGNDPSACKAAGIFKAHLAQLAGDFGLSFGADGGVIFVGGLAQKNPWLFDDEFTKGVSEGGRFSQMRKDLNLYLFQSADFGLRGAHRFAKSALERDRTTEQVQVNVPEH